MIIYENREEGELGISITQKTEYLGKAVIPIMLSYKGFTVIWQAV